MREQLVENLREYFGLLDRVGDHEEILEALGRLKQMERELKIEMGDHEAARLFRSTYLSTLREFSSLAHGLKWSEVVGECPTIHQIP